MTENIRNTLISNAELYETESFVNGDPSWFMHQVSGEANQEALAFIASTLSYGNRKQFMPKIEYLMQMSEGKTASWIRDGKFLTMFPDDNNCFYRLYTNHQMYLFFLAYRSLMLEYGSLGEYVKLHADTGIKAVECICNYFSGRGISVIIPKDTASPCKRVCMFLRWMVRTGSPVDLGLWSFIDKRTLIIPLDTHVLQQAVSLGLLRSKTASMSAAVKLTDTLSEVFPDDPLKGDFALFGYGVNNKQI
ncbi:MAG: TIGR02757 family protein [Paludibacteraceae bacterium]|nr:TIGR02757 family protein [Paludibacteraceae bacterium]